MQTTTLRSITWRAPLVFTAGFGVIAVTLFAIFLRCGGLSFSIKPGVVLNVLSPLILTPGFVERAVEVLISPWRDEGATKLQNALDAAKASVPPDPAKIQTANDELIEYKGTTQRYAFATSLTISLAIGIAGVRTLWPLLNSLLLFTAFSRATPSLPRNTATLRPSRTLLRSSRGGARQSANSADLFRSASCVAPAMHVIASALR
jgi:hypothetical protein